MHMRTTLSIDDDILRIARSIARDSRQSIGEIISRLARRGLSAQQFTEDDLGLPVFEVSENTPPFGPEEVAKGEDEL